MPLYRVTKHEVCSIKAGGTVELTEREAFGFMDKLKLVQADDEFIYPQPPNPSIPDEDIHIGHILMTVNSVKDWLSTDPDALSVETVYEAEKRSDKPRKMALDALEEYLADGS